MGLLERISPGEIVGLFFAFGVIVFLALERRCLRSHPRVLLPLVAFGALCAGWVLTVLEGYFWGQALNLVEHACYAAGATLLTLWIWRSMGDRGGRP